MHPVTHVYVGTCAHMHVYRHAYALRDTCTYIHKSHIQVCTHVCAHKHVHSDTCACLCMHVVTPTCTNTFVHTRHIYVHTNTYTGTYIDTYTCIHTCTYITPIVCWYVTAKVFNAAQCLRCRNDGIKIAGSKPV